MNHALENINRAFQEMYDKYWQHSAASVFHKTNLRVSRFALAGKVQKIAFDLSPHTVVGKPSKERRVVDEDGELVYTVIPVRIPTELNYNTFADDLADLLIEQLTDDEFTYLAIDLRYSVDS